MSTFKIHKGSWQVLKQFDSLQDAQDYAANLGAGYTAVLSEDQLMSLEVQEKLQQDILFGKSLVLLYHTDNRTDQNAPFSDEESALMFQKFQIVDVLLTAGDIAQARDALSVVEIDSIFTQARKDKYLLYMDNYLSI